MRTYVKRLVVLLALVAVIFISCATMNDTKLSVTESGVGSTSVVIYDNGDEKLHVLYSNDALGDVTFIVEGADELVGIELPAFTEGLDEWKEYIASLNKPMNNIFIADHATGKSYVDGMNVLGTEGAAESIISGATFATTDGLYQTFGSDFHGGDELVEINTVIPDGEITVGGITFEVVDRGYTYDVVIPSFNAIYTHMLGKYTHSIITSADYLDEYKTILESYQATGYDIILSAHSGVEGQDAVAEKLSYVENLKKFYEENDSIDDFITAVNEVYPNYSGANYLEMSAGYLY